VWPQKCDRCLQHRPQELECSEPQLNTRKRGPNVSKVSKTRSTPDTQEARSLGGDKALGDKALGDKALGVDSETLPDAPASGRPLRQPVSKSTKRELRGSPKPIPDHPPATDDEYPASAYLPLGEGEFRLLHLDPSSKGDGVTFRFSTESMNQSVEYEAISYLWGGNEAPQVENVKLRDPQGKSFLKSTRKTLYAALRNLRDSDDVKAFWVDALWFVSSSASVLPV
jgi:hypothetical protein